MTDTSYGETKMLRMLSELLLDGETLVTALYCTFRGAENKPDRIGYIALTDQNRVIGYQMGYSNPSPIALDMKDLTRIKISGFLEVKNIDMTFKQDKVKMLFSTKIVGGHFPNQKHNAKIFLSILKEKQSAL